MKPTKKIYDQRTFIDNHRAGNHHHRTGKFDAMVFYISLIVSMLSLFPFPH
jgi:hypothetical protein